MANLLEKLRDAVKPADKPAPKPKRDPVMDARLRAEFWADVQRREMEAEAQQMREEHEAYMQHLRDPASVTPEQLQILLRLGIVGSQPPPRRIYWPCEFTSKAP